MWLSRLSFGPSEPDRLMLQTKIFLKNIQNKQIKFILIDDSKKEFEPSFEHISARNIRDFLGWTYWEKCRDLFYKYFLTIPEAIVGIVLMMYILKKDIKTKLNCTFQTITEPIGKSICTTTILGKKRSFEPHWIKID